MHLVIENYLSKVNNLAQLDPKNLPFDVLEAMGEMSTEELFKTCIQLSILQNNIPSDDKVLTLGEDEMLRLAEDYAQAVLKRIHP